MASASPAPPSLVPQHLRPLPRSASAHVLAPASSSHERHTRAMSIDSDEGPARKRSKTPSSSSSFATGGGARGQMVWTATDGFLSERTLAHRAAQAGPPPLPVAPNAAERILQSLESLRSPLAGVPAFVAAPAAGLPRLGRIHIPTSASSPALSTTTRAGGLAKSKKHPNGAKEGPPTSALISPYGRERERRARLDAGRERSGLRNALGKSWVKAEEDEVMGDEGGQSGEEEDDEDAHERRERGPFGSCLPSSRRVALC